MIGVIEVVRPGLLDLVVDLVPRRGLRFGLSEAGPVDAPALRAANLLVGNPPEAAGLELLARGPALRIGASMTLCLTGGALEGLVDGVVQPVGQPFPVEAGAIVSFRRARPGLRAYLAVRGGLVVEPVLGSRSADVPAALPALAGRALRAGDLLPVGDPPSGDPAPACAPWPCEPPVHLRALPGPQWRETPLAVRRYLFAATFVVTPAASRVGIVLASEPSPPAWRVGELVSEATLAGSVQWTPAGNAVLLLQDRGSIGGYPKPIQVIAVDVWRSGQLRPGDRFRFVRTTRRHALEALSTATAVMLLDDVSRRT